MSSRNRSISQPDAAVPANPALPAPLPRGRVPSVGMRELVAAVHRRRERRRESAAELHAALSQLAGAVERHLARIAQLRDAVEAQGGDLGVLQHYDTVMARLRAELRAAERSLAVAFRDAATHPATEL